MLNLSVQSDAGGPASSQPCTVWLLAREHSSVLGTPWEIPSMNSLCWTRTQGIEIPGADVCGWNLGPSGEKRVSYGANHSQV